MGAGLVSAFVSFVSFVFAAFTGATGAGETVVLMALTEEDGKISASFGAIFAARGTLSSSGFLA